MIAYRATVVDSRAHDPGAFTQGLDVVSGDLLESTGGYGESTLRRYVGMGPDRVGVARPDRNVFAEDICLVDDRVVQLTWRESVALVWSLPDLSLVERLPYDREGWGICFDGSNCYTSDGSAEIVVRGPRSLRSRGSLPVHLPDGSPVDGINALSYGHGVVWANKGQSCRLFAIDPASGLVVGTTNLWRLFMDDPANSGFGANGFGANGVVVNDDGSLWVTGKLHHLLLQIVLHR